MDKDHDGKAVVAGRPDRSIHIQEETIFRKVRRVERVSMIGLSTSLSVCVVCINNNINDIAAAVAAAARILILRRNHHRRRSPPFRCGLGLGLGVSG